MKIDISQHLGAAGIQHGNIFEPDHLYRPFPEVIVNHVVLHIKKLL